MAELHVSTTPPAVTDVNLTFGDGVGFDTLRKMFDHLEGYVVGIDGNDYVFMQCERHADDWVFAVREYPPPAGKNVGAVRRIKLGDLTSFHIF